MKRLFITLLVILFFTITSCLTKHSEPEYIIKTVKISKITKSGVNDFVFHDDGTDLYYINRGLEKGLNLDSLNAKVLNKTVTLHLAKVFGGITSEHISLMTLDHDIIYTEFSSSSNDIED